MRRWRKILLAGSFLLFGSTPSFAADPVKYQVKFVPSGDPTLDQLLRETSSLEALRAKQPPAPFTLIGRAQADSAQFLTVLHSLGYDSGRVDITIDGLSLTDPQLLADLEQAPSSAVETVTITPHKGSLFHIGTIAAPGLPKGFPTSPLPQPGAPALAAPILNAAATLQKNLHNSGYAFATVAAPLAMADPATHKLNLTYKVTPGPRVKIGSIAFSGLKRTDPAFLRRHIALRPGQVYSAASLADARDSLLGLGLFTSVTPVPDKQPNSSGAVPITFNVKPQKRHAVSLTGAYATDTGLSLGTSWEDRNVFRRAETLTLSATANGLGGTGASPGYDLKALFAKPDFYRRGQSLSVSVEGVRESLTAYSRTAFLAGGTISHPIGAHMSFNYGPSFTDERVNQEGVTRTYVLAQTPLSISYNTANSVLEPTHGINASLTLTPTVPVQGGSGMFLIAFASAATYLPVEQNGWGILALRANIGSIQGAGQFQIPPDQRFYAGGSGTVRGYTYQTIGPLFPDDKPEGGLSMDSASVEFRQHITKHIGIVPFVDMGQASARSTPFTGTIRIGVGIGGRYYTSIGPIRADIAFPLTRVAGSGGFALYVGLGEAF